MRVHDGLRWPLVSALASALALLMAGCPGDDGSPMDTDTDTETEGTTGATTGDPTATPDTSTTTADTTTSVDTTNGSEDTTGPGEESSTGDPPGDGVCIGVDQVGDIGTVYSRQGTAPDTTCEPAPTPCGGDVLGTWDIESACGFDSIPNPLEEDCPGSTFDFEVVGQSGSITFEDDGTFVRDDNVELQAILTLDTMACFMIDCATFEGFVQMDDPSVTCEETMGMCACTIPPAMGVATMGTYEVMADTIILDVDGELEALEFCISGDRFDAWSPVFDGTETEIACEDEQDCEDELGNMHELYLCEDPIDE